MRNAKVMLGAAIWALTCAAAAEETNLVKNPGFNEGTAYWSFSNFEVKTDTFPQSGNLARTACPQQFCIDTLGSGAYIKQVLATTAGESYDLSFWVMPRYDASEFTVFWNGQLVDRQLLQGHGETLVMQSYAGLIATTGQTELEIHGRNPPAYIYFDNFSVVNSTSPVPEPLSSTTLMCGLGVLGFMRWRRSQQTAASTAFSPT